MEGVALETGIWYQQNMEHNIHFGEKEEVVNYARAYAGEIIPLFETAMTHNLTTI